VKEDVTTVQSDEPVALADEQRDYSSRAWRAAAFRVLNDRRLSNSPSMVRGHATTSAAPSADESVRRRTRRCVRPSAWLH
jgi:hypothetical protein